MERALPDPHHGSCHTGGCWECIHKCTIERAHRSVEEQCPGGSPTASHAQLFFLSSAQSLAARDIPPSFPKSNPAARPSVVNCPRVQTMEVELWDSSLVAVWDTSLVSGNKHIATATFKLEEVSDERAFGKGLWKGWLKFVDLQSGFKNHFSRTFQASAKDSPDRIGGAKKDRSSPRS